MGCDLVIATTGEGLQTRYTIVPAPVQGTMPVIRPEEKVDLASVVRDSISLEEFAQQSDPPVRAVRTASGDIAPTDVPEDGVDLDEIPF
jgi:hypothetical protein